MSRDKMEKVMYDLQLGQALLDVRRNDFSTDKDKEALFESIYRKHKIDKEILDSSLVWYAVNNMDVLLKINDSVTSDLRKQLIIFDDLNKEELAISERRRQERLMEPWFYLSADQPLYYFNIDSVNKASIDLNTITELRFKALGISPDISLHTAARLEYADTVIINEFLKTDTAYIVTVPQIKDDSLKNISGYMRAESELRRFNILLYNIDFQQDSTRKVMTSKADSILKENQPKGLSIKEN